MLGRQRGLGNARTEPISRPICAAMGFGKANQIWYSDTFDHTRAQIGTGEIPGGMTNSGLDENHMKIAIGSDHAGFQYKTKIKEFLESLGHSVTDFGTDSEAPVDYPLFIRPVAEAVACGEVERGVVLGGSGNGEAIVANRVKGVRCALCWNADSARLGRQHNNANVLSLGQRMVTLETALELVKIWLETPFEGGRHQHRIDLIDLIL